MMHLKIHQIYATTFLDGSGIVKKNLDPDSHFWPKKNYIWFFPPKLEYIFEYFFLKKKWKREKTIFTTFSENKEKQKEKIWEKMKLKNMEKTEKIIGKNVWK